jgi:hypothetical protein
MVGSSWLLEMLGKISARDIPPPPLHLIHTLPIEIVFYVYLCPASLTQALRDGDHLLR